MLLGAIFYIAVTADAMSGALAAGRRKMDWFGTIIIAFVTALGGGTARDILLDHYPLTWVGNPYLLLLVTGAALVTIAIARVAHRLRWPFLILDALGLVAFTIIGCNVALEFGHHPIIIIVSGMITGIVGGILRDVLCNDIPLVFSAELYATVSIVTGSVYLGGLALGFSPDLMVILAMAIGFPFRMAAIVFHWEMPKFVYDKDLR